MGEGFGQFVFLLVILAWAALDAMGRNKKKRQRMDEMERQEAEGGTATRTRGGVGREEDRETADAMIPEDFWAILTGQVPVEEEAAEPDEQAWEAEGRRQAEERQAEAASREGTEASKYREAGSEDYRTTGPSEYRSPRSDPDPPRTPRIPVPTPSDRYTSDAERTPEPRAPTEEPAATRRGSGWMEGLGRREAERAEEDAIRAQEAQVYGELGEPWGSLDDIAAGEIDADGAEAVIGADEDPVPSRTRRRRARGTSPYTRFVESGDREDLKKAMVLKEVLGSPAGFRAIGHEWGEG